MPLSVCNSVQNILIATMLATVSAGKEKAIRLYELQPDSEKLEQHEQCNLQGSPESQYVSPDGQTAMRLGPQRQQRSRISH